MLKLLPVTFRRMFKFPIYWICFCIMLANMMYGIINNYYYTNLWDLGLTPDTSLFAFLGDKISSIINAVFICLFIALEYGNKTIRNKIVVGHSKPSIYLSNVIVCSMGALIMHIIPLIMNATVGVALLGGYENPNNNIIYILCSMFSVVAKVAIVVFFAMLITSRTYSLILVVTVVFLLTSAGQMINMALDEPKIIEDHTYDENLNIIATYEMENPDYVDGTERKMLEFAAAFIPYAQEYRYGNPELPDNIAMYPIFTLGFTTIATTGGVLIFRRKDIN